MTKLAKFSAQTAVVSRWERSVETWRTLAAKDATLAPMLERAQRRLLEEVAVLEDMQERRFNLAVRRVLRDEVSR